MATIAALLAQSGLPGPEAARLLELAAGVGRVAQIAHPEAELDGRAAAQALAFFARRREGEPLAYLLGEREFWGLSLRVTPDVLIPRPDTELLVEQALERLPSDWPRRVLDLGTGSGAIAIAISLERPNADVSAVDSSPAALEVARGNAARLGARVHFVQSDWFSALGSERFDLIVANPPYIAEGDAHLAQGDLRHEPRQALASGEDGLDALRAITSAAPPHLEPGGWLLLEHGYDQQAACRSLLRAQGFSGITNWRDLAGHARVTGGRLH